jgi:hypothetical protein
MDTARPAGCAFGPIAMRCGGSYSQAMGLFDLHGARDAHEQIYGGRRDHDATHELLAGAAGFEAMRMYEHHREREGIVEHHALGKEMMAGFALAEVDKHFDEGRYGHMDRHEAKKLAREQAFGLYEHRGW